MFGNKGIQKVSAIIIGVLLVMLLGVSIYSLQLGEVEQQAIADVEGTGEFDTLFQPEATGSRLTVTETTIVEDGDYTNGSEVMSLTWDLNDTNAGTITKAGYGLEISRGGLEDVVLEANLDTVTADEVPIKDAYIMIDDDETSINSEDARYHGTVTDEDEVVFEIDALPSEDYVVVYELETVDASGIASGASLIVEEWDASTDDDVDAFSNGILNG